MKMKKVEGIDIREVRYPEKKIKHTMCRLNKLRTWDCALKYEKLKTWMLCKLQRQLVFLLQVNVLKEPNLITKKHNNWAKSA